MSHAAATLAAETTVPPVTTTVFNVLFDDRVGGPQRRVVGVAQRLASQGVSTILVLPEGSGSAEDFAREHGVDVVRIAMRRPTGLAGGLGPLRYLASVPVDVVRFARLFRRDRPEVVHVNGALHLAPAVAARIAGRSLVWHLNDTLFPPRIARSLGRVVARLATTVVAAADRVAEHYGVDGRATIVPAPVDIAAFPPRTPGERSEPPVVGMIANWNRLKGQDRYVQVIERLAERGVRGVLVGAKLDSQREFVDEVEADIERLGVRDRISEIGFDPEPASRLASFDVALLTSRSEASPTTVIEAMAVGVPIVVFDVGGVRTMLERPGRTAGRVVPEGDVDAMAAAVAELLDDPAAYAECEVNGPALVRDEFSLDRCVERHLEVYGSSR